MSGEIIITQSIHAVQKNEVARLYHRAFYKKFSALWLFIKEERKVVPVLRESIHFQDGFYAVLEGNVIGFVGIETGERFYTQLSLSAFLKAYNIVSASWRYMAYGLYRLFHGRTGSDAVHIDPIVVSSEARGMGVGTKLLEAVFNYAKKHRKRKVILEVVDTNPRARKLYEKMGFRVVKVENTMLLTSQAGFQKVYHMEKIID